MEPYFQEFLSRATARRHSPAALMQLKRELCRKHGLSEPPDNITILMHAAPAQHRKLKALLVKPVRSRSGVAVIAVMTKPISCPHGKCLYCPGGPGSVFGDVPMSYTGKEPSTMRAMRAGYDPYRIVFNRLEQYVAGGHMPDKVELILQGGTFPAFPKRYQEEVVRLCFKAMNDFGRLFFLKGTLNLAKFKAFFALPGAVDDSARAVTVTKHVLAEKRRGKSTLLGEQRKNERAVIRCVGLTIETKPDWGRAKHGNEMLKLGCTRVELGVQSVYDEVLKHTNRGHTLAETRASIAELRDLGFKLNFHYMPGSPGTGFQRLSYEQDLAGMRELFDNPDFRPDMLKLYPCMVMPGTPLEHLHKQGKFDPMRTAEAAQIIAEFKRSVPPYCRIMRVQRDIPTNRTLAGVDRTNLRQHVDAELQKQGITCHCIRCREIGERRVGKWKINVLRYGAANGVEYFISADTPDDKLIGFCRMRFPSRSLRKEITGDSALIRELHVYGMAVPIGEAGEASQHRGVGKELLREAERIAKKEHRKKIVVISGVGVRQYYHRLGYRRDGPYMAKALTVPARKRR